MKILVYIDYFWQVGESISQNKSHYSKNASTFDLKRKCV